jgi:hypothetical protein
MGQAWKKGSLSEKGSPGAWMEGSAGIVNKRLDGNETNSEI